MLPRSEEQEPPLAYAGPGETGLPARGQQAGAQGGLGGSGAGYTRSTHGVSARVYGDPRLAALPHPDGNIPLRVRELHVDHWGHGLFGS